MALASGDEDYSRKRDLNAVAVEPGFANSCLGGRGPPNKLKMDYNSSIQTWPYFFKSSTSILFLKRPKTDEPLPVMEAYSAPKL